MRTFQHDLAHAGIRRTRNGALPGGGYAYQGTGRDTLTPSRSEAPVAVIPATEENLRDLGYLIGAVAFAFEACEGCREPEGHTTDCEVKPGRLAPHGTYPAARRHERRREELCEACLRARSEQNAAFYRGRKAAA